MKKRLLTVTKDFEAISESSINQEDVETGDEVLPSKFGFIYF